MKEQELEVEQLKFGITNGRRQKTTTTRIRLYLSKPLLQHIINTMPQNMTPSERINELIIKGMKETKKCP